MLAIIGPTMLKISIESDDICISIPVSNPAMIIQDRGVVKIFSMPEMMKARHIWKIFKVARSKLMLVENRQRTFAGKMYR